VRGGGTCTRDPLRHAVFVYGQQKEDTATLFGFSIMRASCLNLFLENTYCLVYDMLYSFNIIFFSFFCDSGINRRKPISVKC